MAQRTKHPLTKQAARKRTIKGWETKRRKHPEVQFKPGLHKIGERTYHWQRPNGEVVPIHGFTDRQVLTMSPAFKATDRHLRSEHKLNTEIRATDMSRRPLTGHSMGGYFVPSGDKSLAKHTPGVAKAFHLLRNEVPIENWGKRNTLAINTRHLDSPNPAFHPAGIVAHELGHVVGPGPLHSKSDRQISEMEKSFQWKAPRDQNKHVKRHLVDIHATWEKKGKHPTKKGSLLGRPNYHGETYHEDFAETYRSLVGVPMETRHNKIHPISGQPLNKNSAFYWEDKNGSREKYMLKYYLKSTALGKGNNT